MMTMREEGEGGYVCGSEGGEGERETTESESTYRCLGPADNLLVGINRGAALTLLRSWRPSPQTTMTVPTFLLAMVRLGTDTASADSSSVGRPGRRRRRTTGGDAGSVMVARVAAALCCSIRPVMSFTRNLACVIGRGRRMLNLLSYLHTRVSVSERE